jgi:hypothetical protein
VSPTSRLYGNIPDLCASWGRYLTKICDQVIVFISREHAETMVWDGKYDADLDADDEESDRMYTFEVAKTMDQQENVSTRPGFRVTSPLCVFIVADRPDR